MDSRFSDPCEIGAGTYGTVYKAFDLKLCRHVAIKCVNCEVNGKQKSDALDAIEKEYKLMTGLQHPNVVSVLDCVSTATASQIVLEWMPSGSVADIIKQQGRLHETIVKKFLRDMLEGVKYLHDNNIVHRDIKPGNMLVSSEGTVKISDFGVSKEMSESHSGNTLNLVGTVRYMAPEAIQQQNTRASDVWAVGCTAVAMLSGKAPWYDAIKPTKGDAIPLIFHIGNAKPPNHHPAIPEHASAELQQLLLRCFAFEAASRPTVDDLLGDGYFMAQSESTTCESFEDYTMSLKSGSDEATATNMGTTTMVAGSTAIPGSAPETPPPLMDGTASSVPVGASHLLQPAAPSDSTPVAADVEDPNESPTYAHSQTNDKEPKTSPHSSANNRGATPARQVSSSTGSEGMSSRQASTSTSGGDNASRPLGSRQTSTSSGNNTKAFLIVWQYAETSTIWKDFSRQDCEHLSVAYATNGGHGTFVLQIRPMGGHRTYDYSIDFDRMTQMNVQTKKLRKIRMKPANEANSRPSTTTKKWR